MENEKSVQKLQFLNIYGPNIPFSNRHVTLQKRQKRKGMTFFLTFFFPGFFPNFFFFFFFIFFLIFFWFFFSIWTKKCKKHIFLVAPKWVFSKKRPKKASSVQHGPQQWSQNWVFKGGTLWMFAKNELFQKQTFNFPPKMQCFH